MLEETNSSAAAVAPLSSLAMAMLFGTITFATVALATRTWLIGDTRAINAAMSKRSEPLDSGSLSSIYTLLHHFSVFGFILFFTYICEHHPFFPHDEKTYDRDQFFFLIILIFVMSFYTVQKNEAKIKQSGRGSVSTALGDKLQAMSDASTRQSKPRAFDEASFQSFGAGTVQTSGTFINAKATSPFNDVLNRDQTEEWKGWMQFIFLIYHYYHAEEIYNSIRIMITCYVWMTGFGNFSFFYLKEDYSFARVAQMLWRLNFLCISLCLTQGTTYILYYICPLHTYSFLMVYFTMRVGKHLNYSKYGLRIKLSFVALLIFFVWDVNSSIFRWIHLPFFGTKPMLGASNGAMWEWYFRTTLDHWSTFLGMCFAANFPITSLLFRKMEALPPAKCWIGKLAIGLPLLFALILWAKGPFTLEKHKYNITNPYFGFLPLITYIYFRNLTPTLRSYSLKLLHEIGKTTLETYLLQHHIWLTSNAKTILVLIPGWPKVNMIFVTFVYFYISRRVYRMTLFLRGMLLPNDKKKCVRSLIFMACTIALFCALATYMKMFGFGNLKTVAIVSIIFGALLYQTVMDSTWESYVSSDVSDEVSKADTAFTTFGADSSIARIFPPIIGCMVILIVGIAWQGMAVACAGMIKSLHPGCGSLINNGKWIPVDGCNEATRGFAYRKYGIVNFATCSPAGSAYTWGWDSAPSSSHCRFTQRTQEMLQKSLRHNRIVFVGDSMTRNLYHAVSRQIGISDAGLYDAGGPKHIDLYRKGGGIDLDFKWAALATDQLSQLKELNQLASEEDHTSYNVVVMGGSAWDRLHVYETTDQIDSHSDTMNAVKAEMIVMRNAGVPVIWMTPTTINDPALNSPEKRERLTEASMEDMRQVYEKLGIPSSASFVLDGPSFSKDRVRESFDGVHYPQDVYDAGAQILANSFDWLLPERTEAEEFKVLEPGTMARPFLGLMMLCLCFISLFFFDGFFGFSYLACLFVKGLLPSDLYHEAFTILHESSDLPDFSTGMSTASFSPDSKKDTNSSDIQMSNQGVRRRAPPANDSYEPGIDDEIEALLANPPAPPKR